MLGADVSVLGVVGVDLDTRHLPVGERPIDLDPVRAASFESIPPGMGSEMERLLRFSIHVHSAPPWVITHPMNAKKIRRPPSLMQVECVFSGRFQNLRTA